MVPRRNVLGLTIFGITTAITGCIGGVVSSRDDQEPWPPEITTAEPALTPGERGTLTVNISNAGGVAVDGDDELSFDREGADVSPSPAGMLRTNPGRWFWETPSAVEIDLPVVVDETTPAGRYRYEVDVSAKETGSDGEYVTEPFDIFVVE